jgi:hypothetical protein
MKGFQVRDKELATFGRTLNGPQPHQQERYSPITSREVPCFLPDDTTSGEAFSLEWLGRADLMIPKHCWLLAWDNCKRVGKYE